MYEEKWGLEDKPFQNVPDTKYMYYSASHEEALVRLLYCVTESKGLMLLLGRWGVGKTFVCRTFKEKVTEKGYQIHILHPPPTSVDDFLRQLAIVAGNESGFSSRVETYHHLEDLARSLASVGRELVLIVDDAQFIRKAEVLEELRLLLDMTAGGRFLMNVVLVGVPEVWNAVKKVEGLRQRIGITYRIEPLSRPETEEYIWHRLQIAGLNHNIFLPEAVDVVFRESLGVPGVINRLCDLSMLIATGEGLDDITPAAVQAAADEIAGSKVVEEEEAV